MPNTNTQVNLEKLLQSADSQQQVEKTIHNLQTIIDSSIPIKNPLAIVNDLNTLKTVQTLIEIRDLEVMQCQHLLKYYGQARWGSEEFKNAFVTPPGYIIQKILKQQRHYETDLQLEFSAYLNQHHQWLFDYFYSQAPVQTEIIKHNALKRELFLNAALQMAFQSYHSQDTKPLCNSDVLNFVQFIQNTDFTAYRHHWIYAFQHQINSQYTINDRQSRQIYKRGLLALVKFADIPIKFRQMTLDWWSAHTQNTHIEQLESLYQLCKYGLIFPSDYFKYQEQFNVENPTRKLKRKQHYKKPDTYTWCIKTTAFNRIAYYKRISNTFIDLTDMAIRKQS